MNKKQEDDFVCIFVVDEVNNPVCNLAEKNDVPSTFCRGTKEDRERCPLWSGKK